MLRLAALGALGYAGYRYFQKNRATGGAANRSTMADGPRLAGGPLSGQATVQHSADSAEVGL
jgi:uncharacterized membrane protein YebE (DUF533 family)